MSSDDRHTPPSFRPRINPPQSPGPTAGSIGYATPGPSGVQSSGSSNSHVLVTGAEALKRAAAGLKNPSSYETSNFAGDAIKITTGDTFGLKGERMFIGVSYYLYYTENKKFCRMRKGDFKRDEFLDAIAKGHWNALWLVPLLKAEMTFFVAMVGSVAGLIVGGSAAISVFLTKMGTWASRNPKKLRLAREGAEAVSISLAFIFKHCPKVGWLLLRALGDIAQEIPAAAVKGINSDDVAYFVGKMLGGVVKGAGGVAAAASFAFTLKLLGKALVSAIAVSVALRSGPAVVRGSPERARSLVERLMKDGISIKQSEAQEIIAEGCLGKLEFEQRLKKLAGAVNDLLPVIDAIGEAIDVASTPGSP